MPCSIEKITGPEQMILDFSKILNVTVKFTLHGQL